MNVKAVQIGDLVYCRCPVGMGQLPPGLPENARAKVVATYIGSTFVEYDDKTFIVPNACVHDGTGDSGLGLGVGR